MIAESGYGEYPFIWSIFLLPSIFLMVMYPNWKVVLGSAAFYTSLKFTASFNQDTDVTFRDIISLTSGSMVNWSIHITLGYFRIKYEKLLQRVNQLTLIDSLTGLYNRRYFDLYLEKALPLSKRRNHSILLIIIDIDHFKKVNDVYGHLCGDRALRHMSDAIKTNIRESDVFVRMGGEEFAILLPETSLEEGNVIAERIRNSVSEMNFTYQNEHVPLTISLGLSIYNGEKMDEFIERSDKALYQAKRNGRNQLVIYN